MTPNDYRQRADECRRNAAQVADDVFVDGRQGNASQPAVVIVAVNVPVSRTDCMEERVTKTFPVARWRPPWFRKAFADSLRAMG
jgi:hypothetical protein